MAYFIFDQLSEEEQKIMEIFRNGDFQEILIKKKDNRDIRIHAKSRMSGNFSESDFLRTIREKDFQTVTAIKENGKIVCLQQEQRIKA